MSGERMLPSDDARDDDVYDAPDRDAFMRHASSEGYLFDEGELSRHPAQKRLRERLALEEDATRKPHSLGAASSDEGDPQPADTFTTDASGASADIQPFSGKISEPKFAYGPGKIDRDQMPRPAKKPEPPLFERRTVIGGGPDPVVVQDAAREEAARKKALKQEIAALEKEILQKEIDVLNAEIALIRARSGEA